MYPHDNIFNIYYNIGKRTPFLVKRCELGLARSSSEERRIDPNRDRTFLVETVKPRGKYGKAYGKCFVNGKPDDSYRQECYPDIKDEEILLRSQTSPVQIRTMLKGNGQKPIRMICPGKTYRRDDDDATHSHQFMQIEGLLVDKNISLSDLKGTFDVIAKKLFGEDCQTRFRPSYYQFTEPSVETDISCFKCHGEGCNICKNTGWITVSGAGMVHPNVLRNCGYDPKEWSGFAFGFGAERLAMLKYGINDIRTFYATDLRELKTFDRKDND
mgnify:CR=1 FL=1